MDDVDVNIVTKLLKSNKLGTYMAQEMDSSSMQILLKYKKNLFLNNKLLYQKAIFKESSRASSTICAAKKIYL